MPLDPPLALAEHMAGAAGSGSGCSKGYELLQSPNFEHNQGQHLDGQGASGSINIGEGGKTGMTKPTAAELFSDPYQIRADEIGPTHGIVGIGHLGKFLTPPGWKPGSVPMDPEGAKRVFQEARQKACEALEKDVIGDEDLPDDELQKKSAARNKKWANELKLQKYILEQRISIFELHTGSIAEWNSGRNFPLLPMHRINLLIIFRSALMGPSVQTSFQYQQSPYAVQAPIVFNNDTQSDYNQRISYPSKSEAESPKLEILVNPSIDAGTGLTSQLPQYSTIPSDSGMTILDPNLAKESEQAYQKRRAELARQMQETYEALISLKWPDNNNHGNAYQHNTLGSYSGSVIAQSFTEGSNTSGLIHQQKAAPVTSQSVSVGAPTLSTNYTHQVASEHDMNASKNPTPLVERDTLLNGDQGEQQDSNSILWSYWQSCLKNSRQGNDTEHKAPSVPPPKATIKVSHQDDDVQICPCPWPLRKYTLRSVVVVRKIVLPNVIERSCTLEKE